MLNKRKPCLLTVLRPLFSIVSLKSLKCESASSCFQPGEGPFIGAFSVIVKTDGSFAALVSPQQHNSSGGHSSAGHNRPPGNCSTTAVAVVSSLSGTARAPYTALAIAARGLCRIENNDIINYVSVHELCVSMV